MQLKPEPGYTRVRVSRAEKLARMRAGQLYQLGRSKNGFHIIQTVRVLESSKHKIVRGAAAWAVARLWSKPIVPPPDIKMTAQDKSESRTKALLTMYRAGSRYAGSCKKLFFAMEERASFKDLKAFIHSRTLAASPGLYSLSLRGRLLKRVSNLADRRAMPFLVSVAENDKSPTMRKQAKYLIVKRLSQRHLQRFDRTTLGATTMRKVVAMIRTLAKSGATPGTRLDATRLLKTLTS